MMVTCRREMLPAQHSKWSKYCDKLAQRGPSKLQKPSDAMLRKPGLRLIIWLQTCHMAPANMHGLVFEAVPDQSMQ